VPPDLGKKRRGRGRIKRKKNDKVNLGKLFSDTHRSYFLLSSVHSSSKRAGEENFSVMKIL
jgi:hypothetical protein